MDIIFLLKGLLIGFTVTAPVGPIGILCINRTLSKGRLTGFVSGLGAHQPMPSTDASPHSA
nr:hypothetical protein [Rossellomorea marisflavi]